MDVASMHDNKEHSFNFPTPHPNLCFFIVHFNQHYLHLCDVENMLEDILT